MKSKKIASLFLALIMVFSTISSTLTVFASDPPPNDGLCPHHTQHTADCGYVAPTPEQPCTHVCSQESGCVQVNCIHVHDESCGYIEGVEGSCSHICSEQTGCIVTQCIHTAHDASCGYAPATEGQPCRNVCPICDCTCTDLCLSNQTENPCPVCAADWTQCSFTTVDVSLRFSDQYAQYGPGQSVDLDLAASISGEKITQANVSIQLTEAEAALLTLPESDGNLALIDGPGAKFLVFAVTANQDTGSGAYTRTLSVQSDGPATLEIAKEDIHVSLLPENYQNSQQVSVSINGDQLTFVKKLPTDGVYGSGTAFDTQVAEVPVNYINEEGDAIARQELAPAFTLYYQVEGDAPAALTEENLPFGLEQMPVITGTPGEHTWTGSVEDASSLPSEVLTMSAGSYEIKPVSWYLIPSYPDYSAAAEYTFVEITEENAAEYPAGLAKGWYYIAGPEPYPDDTITITSYLDSLQHNIYWADNGNVEKKRPETVDGLFELQFSLDGSSVYTTLDESNMARQNTPQQNSLQRQCRQRSVRHPQCKLAAGLQRSAGYLQHGGNHRRKCR